LRVAVVQGDFPQDVKWNPEYLADSVFVHERLSSEAARDGAELIVWSESAVPASLELNPRIKEEVERYADYKDVHLLLGAIRAGQTPGQGHFNSAYLINSDGEIVDWYDKMHLAPFGEYVPLRRVLPFIGRIMPVLSDLSPGKRRTVFNVRGVKFGTLICFETVFPDLVRAMAREDTDFLITITNTAWFGRSAAPFQDLAICVFRAVENRMWLVRAANTGVSCFIDPWGAVKSRVGSAEEPIFVRGWSIEDVGVEKRFSVYRLVGNLFVPLCVAWLAVLGVAGSRRARKRSWTR
jgi:apolipoprotein N-acyltransferase